MTKVRINEKEPYGEPRIVGKIVEAEKIDGKNLYQVMGSELIKHCVGKGCNGFVSYHTYNFMAGMVDVVEEEEKVFKIGDKVRLKEKFYDEKAFRDMERSTRKAVARNIGIVLTASHVEKNRNDTEYRISSKQNEGWASIPVSLLELVEKPVVEVKPKAGTYARITFDVGAAPVGTIVRISIYGEHMDGTQGFTYNYKGNIAYGTIGNNAELVLDYIPVPVSAIRKWTEAEITEAKCIIADAYAEAGYRMTCSHGYDVTDKAYLSVMGYRGKTYEARCCPTDEPNPYIGLMVVLSKATGRELPVWIRRGT